MADGKRMSDYTDIDSAQLTEEQKAYYKENALVTTYGKTGESTGNSNYNVKLSEISKNPLPPITDGDTGKVLTVGDSESLVWDELPNSQPNYGEGLEYDSNTNTLKFNYFGSGGLMSARTLDDKYAMKVKAGVGIEVDNKGVSIDTQHANEGDVLTYHKNGSTDEVVWAAPGGGGGNPFSIDEMLTWKNNMDTTVAAWMAANPESNHIDTGNLQTSIKSVSGVTKYQYAIHAGSGSFFSPWAS